MTESDWTRPLAARKECPSLPTTSSMKKIETKFGYLFHPVCGGAHCLVGGASHLSHTYHRDLGLSFASHIWPLSIPVEHVGERAGPFLETAAMEGGRQGGFKTRQNGEGQGSELLGKRLESRRCVHSPATWLSKASWPRSSALHTCRWKVRTCHFPL